MIRTMTMALASRRRSRLARAMVIAGMVGAAGTIATSALAADGDLDPSFGGDGTVSTAFPGGGFASAVAIQDDGGIVVVGSAAGPSDRGEIAVARYDTAGEPDEGFDGDGMLTTAISGGGDEARAVAVQTNGRIVVAGTAGGRRFALVRYRAGGSLDPSFGEGGIVRTNLTSGGDAAYGVAIQDDGKIVAVGAAGSAPPRFALTRYRRDGSLDPTFGDHGVIIADAGFSVARAVALQPNGRIVVTGFDPWGLRLARYRPDGRPDGSFGVHGLVHRVLGSLYPLAMGLQADGRIVVGGNEDIFEMGLARFTDDGRLDRSFGDDGVVRTHVGPGEQAINGVVVQANGRIVGTGYAAPHESGDTIARRFVAVRCLRTGTLDPSWGTGGKVVTRFPGGGFASGAAAQPDGDIVVVGGGGDDDAPSFLVARYLI